MIELKAAPTHLMKLISSAWMTSSHATASRWEQALQWTDTKTKRNQCMDSSAVLKKGYYLGIKLESTYTDCAEFQNAIITGFPDCDSSICHRTDFRTGVDGNCFDSHVLCTSYCVTITAGEFSNVLIIFFRNFVMELWIVLTAVMSLQTIRVLNAINVLCFKTIYLTM